MHLVLLLLLKQDFGFSCLPCVFLKKSAKSVDTAARLLYYSPNIDSSRLATAQVLSPSQYVAYLLPEGKLYCIVGHAEIPSVLEFEGGNAEIVPFGAFRFAYADTFPKPPDIPSMSRKQRAPHYRRFSIRFASWSRPTICKSLWIPAVCHTKLPPAYLQRSPRHLFPAQQYSIRLA